jgi:hypothetical protein
MSYGNWTSPSLSSEPSSSRQTRPPIRDRTCFCALTETILPDIDGAYRTLPTQRCLYGYSWGGFFTLYALLQQPDTFQHYLAGSPVLEIANDYLMGHDQRLRQHGTQNRIHLYLSMGETEHDGLTAYHRFTEFFHHQSYPGLTLTAETYPSIPHGAEGTALTYLHGLRTVFRPDPSDAAAQHAQQAS